MKVGATNYTLWKRLETSYQNQRHSNEQNLSLFLWFPLCPYLLYSIAIRNTRYVFFYFFCKYFGYAVVVAVVVILVLTIFVAVVFVCCSSVIWLTEISLCVSETVPFIVAHLAKCKSNATAADFECVTSALCPLLFTSFFVVAVDNWNAKSGEILFALLTIAVKRFLSHFLFTLFELIILLRLFFVSFFSILSVSSYLLVIQYSFAHSVAMPMFLFDSHFV